MYNDILKLSSEVKQAFQDRKPVVALESTIIAHGMPYPQNLPTALELENIVRQYNCCPATIFLKDGNIHIGAETDELSFLAVSQNVEKAGQRDIPLLLTRKKTAATTVSATAFCAHLAGIEVFATGGIGGVHRYAEQSFDISSDLTTLQNTPVIIISAGVKAILDIPKTLEYLETAAVPVLGWQTDYFPGFYSSSTPWKVKRIDNLITLKKMYHLQQKLGMRNAVLLANPVPEENEISWQEINLIVEKALKQMNDEDISAQEVTPFLLRKITNLTGGKSLQTNIALVKNNVELACKTALVIAEA